MGRGIVAALLVGAVAGFALGFMISQSRGRRAGPGHVSSAQLSEARRVSRALIWLVGLLYAGSWLLPAVTLELSPIAAHCPPTSIPIPGWMAFYGAIGPLFSGGSGDESELRLVMWAATALTNVVFLGAAIRLLVRPSASIGGWIVALLCAACVNTYWMFTPEFPTGPGYFLWVASFVLLAIAARFRVEAQPTPPAVQPAT